MSGKPKVSVIVTLYNYKEYIKDCIESFLGQILCDSEMVIVDDGSTDNPLSVIQSYISDRIRYLKLKDNTNYSHAKNVGIKHSRADVIAMLDADDMLTVNGLSVRYEKLMEGYDLVHGPCVRLEKNGTFIRDAMWEKWLRTQDPLWIHAQGFMLRKKIHKKIGLYDTWFWSQGDREMLLRIGCCGFRIGTVEEDVAIYRIHKRQMHKSDKKKKARKKLDQRMRSVLAKRRNRKDLSGLEMLK